MKRKVWLLSGRAFGKGLLGPAVRLCELAKAALAEGHEVHVAVVSPESNPLPGDVVLHDLAKLDLDKIRHGDGLVYGPYLPAPIAWKMLRSGIPYHLDLYCMTATEQMALWARTPGKGRDTERLKLRKRYLLHAQAAETIYVSCIEQWMVLAGMFLSEGDWKRAGLADSLASKIVELPMGVREDVFPTGAKSPYPEDLRSRPIFLWGGSLWNWFDLETLVEAFRILDERGSGAALFFLSGGNATERASEDDPVRWVEMKAREAGLLGRNIYFNTSTVRPAEIAPWLEHCRAGVLTNPNSLEALSSWRTRFLDLIWAEKPLAVSGRDPLGTRMENAGCAIRVPAGAADHLADAIERFASDPTAAATAGGLSNSLAKSLSWSRNLSPFLHALADPNAFGNSGMRPGILEGLDYLLT